MKIPLIGLVLGFATSAFGQVPAYEATQGQVDGGTNGSPYYVSPRGLAGRLSGNFPSGTNVYNFTNTSYNFFGAILTNPVTGDNDAVIPAKIAPYQGTYIYNVGVTNTGDPLKDSIAIGGSYTAGYLPYTNGIFNVYGFNGFGDSHVGLFRVQSKLTGNWHNSAFYGGQYCFESRGPVLMNFFSCQFNVLSKSLFASNAGSFVGVGTVTDTGATNNFYACRFLISSNDWCVGHFAEVASVSTFNNCTFDVGTFNSSQASGVEFSGEGNTTQVILNNCVFNLYGGSTYRLVSHGQTATDILRLYNVNFQPSTNGVVVDNAGVVYVSGGNWQVANFSSPNLVVWLPTNSVNSGFVLGTNGLASTKSVTTAISSTSNWTNTMGVNCTAYVTATTVTLKNSATTTLVTYGALVAVAGINMQPGWYLTGTAIVGTALAQ